MAQALPTYTMSTFDIPTKACDKLDALTRKFGGIQKTQMEGIWLGWLGKNYVYLKELEGWDSKRASILIKLSWLNLLG